MKPINQPTNQPTNQSTDQPINESTNQPINQSTDQPINQSTYQPINRLVAPGCLRGPQHSVSWFESVVESPMMFARKPYTAADVIGTGVACYICERYVIRSWTRLYCHIHARHASFEVLWSTELCRFHRREEQVWRQAESRTAL